ncbi:transcription initiation factor IIB family protein [Halosimplex aquaticum]
MPGPDPHGRTAGEVVCRDCGLVVDETVLVSNRARTDPGDDSDVGRVGSPTSPRFHDRGLTTVIDGGERDANGNRLSQRKLSRIRRLRTWNARCLARNGAERSLQFGLSELERMASAVGLSDSVREVASVLFRRAHEAGVQRGRSLEAAASAALYAAARSEGLPLTIDTVAEASRVDRRSFVRAYRETIRELSLEIGPPDPSDHVASIASDLDASDAVTRRARSLLDRAKRDDYHVGKHPSGMAAAAVYAASLIEEAGLTQLEISDAADVCAVTIRDHYSAMLDEWRADA